MGIYDKEIIRNKNHMHITVAQFAKILGITKQAVHEGLKRNKIPDSFVKLYAKNERLSPVLVIDKRAIELWKIEAKQQGTIDDKPDIKPGTFDPDAIVDFATAKYAKETILAKKAALELARAEATVIDTKLVEKLHVILATEIKNILLAVPSKEASVLVQINDVNEMRERLEQIMNKTLEKLSKLNTKNVLKQVG